MLQALYFLAAVVSVMIDSSLSRTHMSMPRCQPRIEQLFLGFRHGARATYLYLPDDPNNDYFTVGPAQLTHTGLRQMYASGETVRNRYAGLIRVPYVPNEVRIKSTLYDRTIMSASVFAAALFRPTEEETWLRGVNWQPVAIYTTKNLVAIDPTNSETMRDALNSLIESDHRLRTTVNEIERATDIRHKELFQEFFYVIENFKTEMFYNLTLPYGLDDHRREVDDLINKLIITSYARPDIFCLNAPAILNDIIKQIDNYIEGTVNQYLTIYSLHDGHVSAFLASLTDEGMAEMTPFAATFFIEVHQNDTCNGHVVKLLYRTEVTEDPREVSIRGCRRPCSTSHFRRLVKRILRMCNYDASTSLDDGASSNEPKQDDPVDTNLVSAHTLSSSSSSSSSSPSPSSAARTVNIHVHRPSFNLLAVVIIIITLAVVRR